MRQLLPVRARVGLERLRQLVDDVSIAWTRPLRPPSTTRFRPSPPAEDPPTTNPDAGQHPVERPAVPVTPEFPADADADEATGHRVVFEHLGEEVVVGPDQSILDAGREAGLGLEFSCTVGGCAACALQIVEGEVVYDTPTCLTEDEQESGMCLACVGRPDGDLVLTSRF